MIPLSSSNVIIFLYRPTLYVVREDIGLDRKASLNEVVLSPRKHLSKAHYLMIWRFDSVAPVVHEIVQSMMHILQYTEFSLLFQKKLWLKVRIKNNLTYMLL